MSLPQPPQMVFTQLGRRQIPASCRTAAIVTVGRWKESRLESRLDSRTKRRELLELKKVLAEPLARHT
jgi:hypothetical protein